MLQFKKRIVLFSLIFQRLLVFYAVQAKGCEASATLRAELSQCRNNHLTNVDACWFLIRIGVHAGCGYQPAFRQVVLVRSA